MTLREFIDDLIEEGEKEDMMGAEVYFNTSHRHGLHYLSIYPSDDGVDIDIGEDGE